MLQGDKIRSYHSQLKVVLRDFINTQKDGGFDHKLRYKNQYYNLHFKIPIALIIGDCEEHDKLCGRYGSHHPEMQCICQDCDCSAQNADDPEIKCKKTKQATIKALVDQEDLDGLHDISQHFVKNAFYDACFGGNPYGIHGCIPVEVLHLIQLGLYQYALQCLFDLMTNKYKSIFDDIVGEISILCQHQSDRKLPRFFPTWSD